MRGLNLGCGNRVIEGFVNHDISKHRPEIDVIWDLNITPWPFADDEFDAVEIIAVVEHLKLTLIETLDEIWRILKKDGVLTVKYPIYTSETIHHDPTHRWHLAAESIDYVIPGTRYGDSYSFYTDKKWRRLDGGVIKGRNYKARLSPIKD